MGYAPVAIVEAQGHSGGLWVLQHTGLSFSISVFDAGDRSITLELSKGHQKWYCTGLYANPNPIQRHLLWNYLSSLKDSIHGPWFIIGDFNEVLFLGDIKGGMFVQRRADALFQVMNHCDLVDLPISGGKFTWHCKRQGQRYMAKKLDRAMANLEWRMAFPEATTEVLNRHHSDHNPLFMRCGPPQSRGTCPFRFEAAWLTHLDYPMV